MYVIATPSENFDFLKFTFSVSDFLDIEILWRVLDIFFLVEILI